WTEWWNSVGEIVRCGAASAVQRRSRTPVSPSEDAKTDVTSRASAPACCMASCATWTAQRTLSLLRLRSFGGSTLALGSRGAASYEGLCPASNARLSAQPASPGPNVPIPFTYNVIRLSRKSGCSYCRQTQSYCSIPAEPAAPDSPAARDCSSWDRFESCSVS